MIPFLLCFGYFCCTALNQLKWLSLHPARNGLWAVIKCQQDSRERFVPEPGIKTGS